MDQSYCQKSHQHKYLMELFIVSWKFSSNWVTFEDVSLLMKMKILLFEWSACRVSVVPNVSNCQTAWNLVLPLKSITCVQCCISITLIRAFFSIGRAHICTSYFVILCFIIKKVILRNEWNHLSISFHQSQHLDKISIF